MAEKEREIIQTLIFMDLETAGPWLGNRKCGELRPREQTERMDFSQHLAKLVASDNTSSMPRITEMSFLSVPRCLFEEAVENMEYRLNDIDDAIERRQPLKDEESIKIDVAANIYTCQLNPELSDEEWDSYELEGRSNRLRRSELRHKNVFSEEWQIVHLLLRKAPKPACLIAHNGLEYDFRILLHELMRTGSLNAYPIPEEIYFVDSYLSFVNIEEKHHLSIKQTVDNINWNLVARQEPIVVPSSVINNFCESEQQQTEEQHEDCNVNDEDDIQYLGSDCHLAESEPNTSVAENEPPSGNEQIPTRQLIEEEEITVVEEYSVNCSQRSGTSDPLCSKGKRKAPSNELPLEQNHPFYFLRRRDWCPAKRRRIPTRIFNKNNENQWYFSAQVSELCLKQAGRYKLEKMFRKIIGTNYKAHRAQSDCEALLQVSLAYGQDFLQFVDNRYAKFTFILDGLLPI